ncbi:universal stress protein [Cellulomonas bogoriensis]|uniref:Universal stress protein UspA n=1 Tax=Cellulomonas bogoriensis 69B4 = DSM 16987 TaxID=1386082 RepID=A0A0A0BZT8_9CELL|nr:universal stress protein [Cellulomonas bogoriensis]KGM13192.1 universal stress protein UspA [Cellulomonas bogoriensis 69B4 = DSM 16987]
MTTVVVGTEGTASSDAAVLWAARTAHDRGAELLVVHATGLSGSGLHEYEDATEQAARSLLDAEVARIREHVPVVPRTVVDHRRPGRALCDRSQDAALLVVGSHPHNALERVFSGSLSYQVAAGARCPVVVVPALPAREASDVVVGVDGSADSLAAVRLAAAEAHRTGGELHVVMAWEQPATYVPVQYLSGGYDEQMLEHEKVALAESVAGLAEDYPDLVVHRELVQGRPAPVLLERARGARLLVVGTHGRQGVARMLLGSVAHTLVLHATCPVAVVRIR